MINDNDDIALQYIYENYYVGFSDTHKLNRLLEGLLKRRSKIVLATVSLNKRNLIDENCKMQEIMKCPILRILFPFFRTLHVEEQNKAVTLL